MMLDINKFKETVIFTIGIEDVAGHNKGSKQKQPQ